MADGISPTEVFQREFSEIWESYLEMNQRCHKKGPLDEETCQLIIVAVACHSQVRGRSKGPYKDGFRGRSKARRSKASNLTDSRSCWIFYS